MSGDGADWFLGARSGHQRRADKRSFAVKRQTVT